MTLPPHPTDTPQAAIARHRPVCPVCQGALHRVPRRFVDLLISKFTPVHRYRCAAVTCHWVGNIRHEGIDRRCDRSADGRNFII